MAKYVYPAIITKEDTGYSVNFPDINGCLTSGIDMADTLDAAADALCLMLYDMEERDEVIPKSSSINEIELNGSGELTYITCDTLEYRNYYDNKAIKKTLTIPNWLNTMAEKQNINFSQTLQEALKQQLHL